MKTIRILMISFTSFLQRFYQSLPNEIANSEKTEVRVLVPPHWIELWSKGKTLLESDESVRFKLETGKIAFTGNLHFAFFYTQLAKLIRQFQPHIIDMDNEPFNAGSYQMIRYARKYSQNSVLILHASQHKYKRYPPPFNYFESYNLRHADAILVRNEMARSVLRQKGYQGRLELITHGVDTDAFCPGPCMNKNYADIEKPVIGYVGSLAKHKGLDLLFTAAQDVECRIILIGDGDQKKSLIEHANRLNLDIEFLSALSHAEVAKIMKCFDIFVLPSITQSNWVEKFGRVLIEAMASGCAVIGSSCGEIPTVIGDAGLIFQENDSFDLRNKIHDLVANSEKRSDLGKRGRERACSFYSWKNIAARTLSVYEDLLKDHDSK